MWDAGKGSREKECGQLCDVCENYEVGGGDYERGINVRVDERIRNRDGETGFLETDTGDGD